MAILPAGFFDIEHDAEAKAVSAEIKRDEYKRLLDKIHTIALGCSTQNTIAYVELPGVIERIIAERHKQWERAITAEEKIEALTVTSDPAAAISQAMMAIEKSGCHPLLTDAVVLLEQAKAKMADFERTQALCLLCGHKRGQHDPDNITGNCNAGLMVGFSNQCQCAGFVLMK